MGALEQKVAIVTGGGQGIGKQIALAFAAEGAKVTLTGRTEATLRDTADEVRSAGGEALTVVGDVASEADCATFVEQTIARFGRLDVLVNNAGIAGPTKLTTQMTLAEWQEVIDIDLTGAWLAARAALMHFSAQKQGNILNISSGAGRRGYPFRSPYAAAKWALIGLTQTWAEEWGRQGVRCNCICPGAIEGDRIERVMRARAESMGIPYQQVRSGFESGAALGRMATELEVARTAVFLCSDASAAMTGQTLNVDCGTAMN